MGFNLGFKGLIRLSVAGGKIIVNWEEWWKKWSRLAQGKKLRKTAQPSVRMVSFQAAVQTPRPIRQKARILTTRP